MKKLLALYSLLLLLGCSTTKGYSGAELPSSQVSQIRFLPEGRVSIKNMTVDGFQKDLMDIEISVPAGTHKATVEYLLAMKECPMFSVGCQDEGFPGTCEFAFTTQGGHEYTIEFKGSGESVISNVYDNDNNEHSIATGVCVNREKDYHSSVIRRRSTIGE